LNLESLDARIIPDATPTNPLPPVVTVQVSIPATPPTIPPMPLPAPQLPQAPIPPKPLTPDEILQLKITTLRIEYLTSLTQLEKDIAAINVALIDSDAMKAGLAQAKIDLANAAVADKPEKQLVVDLWQALADSAQKKLSDLIKDYRDDKVVAKDLYEKLKNLNAEGMLPTPYEDEYALDPAINDLVPVEPVPLPTWPRPVVIYH